ncbi:MAG: SH3 domain-containing protein [Pseudomonadota bacterium]
MHFPNQNRLPLRGFSFVLAGLAAAASFLLASPAGAESRKETFSGLPVPRFVEFNQRNAACRQGPSREHPAVYRIRRKGPPVLVIGETRDHWRRVRDLDGDICWAHKSVLRAPKHVYVTEDTELRTRAIDDATVRAVIGAGALSRIEGRKRDWARISVGSMTGWVPISALWGLPETAADAAVRKPSP